MALYESEITQFLRQLKSERPQIEAEQRRGRAMWWDREPIDPERARQLAQSRVPQQAYPYQTEV